MRPLLLSFIIFIAISACETKPLVTRYCQNCDLKTDAINIIENKSGWIIFLSEYNQYAIEVAHYNDPIVYIPCKIPSYFQPVEMASVKFSGTVIEDPYKSGEIIKTTYNCIRLDTIYSSTAKK